MSEKEQISSSVNTPAPQAVPAVATPVKKKGILSLPLLIILGILLILVIGEVIFYFIGNGSGKTASTKVYTIGILSGLDFFLDSSDAFKKEMTTLGYTEGKNVTYEFEQSNIEDAKEKKSMQKFIDDKVDIVLSYPTEPSILAKASLQKTTIPLIFTAAFIEQGGLVDSVTKPGKNVTGVRYPGPDIAAKRLEILHELAPSAKRIWLPYLNGYPPVAKELELVRPLAKSLGLDLIEFPATGPDDLKKELSARSARASTGIDAILLIPEPLAVTGDSFSLVDTFAIDHHIPFGGTYLPNSDSLFGYNPDNAEMGKLAAELTDKVLKGTPTDSLAVVTPEAYLLLNYKAVQKFGLTASESILSRAKTIIR